ncbi:MSC_0620 family F1-like ATPase-associated subunit [Mesomycoplasma lagogenitalium]|uniref:Transmembrane protein n=1 Tax=Mesomycoplasma lagogenitalium TaxID=171286 RepID=A0ABY8LW19_9BACT|nr:hypothetical protein [Mesomycoplasma lagogenitalium]WGI37005.1 hypothetical protein QEG99_01825 [Mesomycoplasma lagogenitalium]
MKTKGKKIISSLSLLTPISVLPIFISADVETPNNNNNNDNNNSANKKKEKSPEFDTFAKIKDEKIKLIFDLAINDVLAKLEEEKLKLKNNNELEFKTKLEKNYYLEILSNYLKTNKEKIIANPNAYNFNVIFPNVFSLKENYKKGKVVFQNKEYNDVIFDENDQLTNYLPLLGDGGRQEVSSEEKNVFTKSEIETFISKYQDSLKEQLYSIIYNENDIPKINEKIFLDPETISKNDGTSISALVSNPPENFKSWDEYIQSRYKDRYTAFDLEQNKTIDEEEPSQNNNQKPEDKIDKLPEFDELDKLTNPGEPFDTKTFIEKLPPLQPEFLAKYVNRSLDEILVLFESSPDSELFFFFNNPINTRYKYSITSIEKTENNNFLGTVKIQDVNDPEIFRLYKTYLTTDTNYNFQKVYENYVSSIKNQFTKLYKAVQLDEKLDFDKLQNQNIKTKLSELIGVISKDLYYTQNFVSKQSNIINQGIKNIADKEINDNQISNLTDILDAQLLVSLKASRIKFMPLFSYLPEAYQESLNAYKEILKKEGNLNKLQEKFAKYNADLVIINKLVNTLDKDISLIIKLANAKTFNILSWYDEYINLLTKISGQFSVLRDLLTNEQPTEEKEMQETQEKNFLAQYQLAHDYLKSEKKSQNLFLVILSSILATASLIGISLSTNNYLKNKKNKNNSLLKTNLAIILLSAVVIVLAIALLALGIIGGI